MNLTTPAFLLLLPVVVAAVCAAYYRRKRPAVIFGDRRLLQNLPSTWRNRLVYLPPLLLGLALASFVIAAAGPRKGLESSVIHTEGIDIVLVVDVSTSMRAEDMSTRTHRINRLDAAKQVITHFIKHRLNDRIGLIAFAAMPYTAAPLTLDHDWLLSRLKQLRTGMVEDGTAIGDAIASAVNRLRKSKARSKVIILLTDGMNNSGTLTPENAAQAARALHIKIYTVGAGANGWAPVPVTDPWGNTHYVRQQVQIDEDMLRRIADLTGASYFRATDFAALNEIYQRIDAMEKTRTEVKKYTSYKLMFAPFLAYGLIFLTMETLLNTFALRRLP